MNGEQLFNAITKIDESLLDEAANSEYQKKHPRFRRGLAAAALALVMLTGSAAIVFASENKEYRGAVAFFEENRLSTEGLSRAEVKAVYRDITEKKFTYGKTAEVIRNASVLVWELPPIEPTAEEVREAWNRLSMERSVSARGIDYRIRSERTEDEAKGGEAIDKTFLTCYRDGTEAWNVEFSDFVPRGCLKTREGGAVVWGIDWPAWLREECWVSLVDPAGQVLWVSRLDHGFEMESIASVLPGKDGLWAVFSRGDSCELRLSFFDNEGREVSSRKIEGQTAPIRTAVRLGDGYILQLRNQKAGESDSVLLRIDGEGSVLESLSYDSEDYRIYVTDVAEFGGQIYLSGYSVPRKGKNLYAQVLEYAEENPDAACDDLSSAFISREELTPMVRDYFSAVLLLCNSQTGESNTVYSMKGSMGGSLLVNESGQLEWDAESITSVYYSPFTNSFTFGGYSKVFRYTFDAEGNLLEETDTGETVPFRR